MISGTTQLYGIFGDPVEHTFSPAMHNAAFKKIGMDACYLPFCVRPDDLGKAVKAIIPLGLRGLNVTVPHKEKVVPYLDELSSEAKLIGAVNTIQIKNGKLIGHNADGRGFVRSLQENAACRPQGMTFLLVGAGGAARAVGFSLALGGAKRIMIHDVDRRKTATLAGDITKKTGIDAVALDARELADAAEASDILINATPLGMKKGDILPIKKDWIRSRHLVCDVVYNPAETALLKTAQARGAAVLPGIGMLLSQGLIAFEIWTGIPAPVAVMKNALVRQIRQHATVRGKRR